MDEKISPEAYNKILFLRSKFDDIDEALLSVAAEGDIEIAKILIANGADANAKDKDNDSALLKAVARGNAPIAELLITSGADVNAENNFGWTAILLAKDRARNDIIKLIEKVTGASEFNKIKEECANLLKSLAETASGFKSSCRAGFIGCLKAAADDFRKGYIDQAVINIKNAFAFDMSESPDAPRLEGACEKAGRAFFRMNKFDEAVFVYSKALELNPINREALDFLEHRNELVSENDETRNISAEITALEKSGDIKAAVEKGALIAEKYPRDAGAHLKLAGLYERAGNHARALFEYERTLELEPERYKRGFLKAAQIARKLGRHRAAIDHLTRAQQNFPADINCRKTLLEEYKFLFFENAAAGGGDEAVKSYERFLSVYENDAMAHLEIAYIYNVLPPHVFSEKNISRHLTAALESAAGRILPHAPAGCELCLMLLNQIRLAFFNSSELNAGRLIDIYKNRAAASPDDAFKCYEAGYLYTYLPAAAIGEKHARESGLQYLIQAAGLEESNAFLTAELARAYCRAELYDNAVEQCDKLLKAAPGDIASSLMKAAALEKKGDFESAMAEYARLASVAPDQGEAHARPIDIYFKLYEKDPARSSKFFHKIQQCKRALKAAGGQNASMLHFALAYAYLKLSDPQDADIENSQMEFKEAISIDEKNLYAYEGLSELYQKQSFAGKKDYFGEAENVCRTAVSKFPHDARAYFLLASAYDGNFRTNKKSEAEAEYNKAVYLEPLCYKPHYRLALIYKSKKMNGQALAEFKKAIEADPASPESNDARRSAENIEKAFKK